MKGRKCYWHLCVQRGRQKGLSSQLITHTMISTNLSTRINTLQFEDFAKHKQHLLKFRILYPKSYLPYPIQLSPTVNDKMQMYTAAPNAMQKIQTRSSSGANPPCIWRRTFENVQKLKRPLLRFPKGYTTKALKNRPTVIPIAT